jgi:flagellar biosynthesis anti-sigma factor FlgM
MRVDLTTLGVEPPENGKPGRAGQTGDTGIAAGSASSATAGSVSGHDQASFSFDQVRLQSLQAQVLAQPEVRSDKVQTLQQAIGSGSYSVSASQVADALVNELAS